MAWLSEGRVSSLTLTPRALATGWLWLVLILVLGASALPRFTDLDHPSLTYDEHYDYVDSLKFCRTGRLTAPVSDGYLNGQLPFRAACVAYGLAGESERAARVVSALAGLGAVVATFLVGLRLFGGRWGLLSALLLGLSPFFVSASRLAFSHGHVFQVPWLVLGLWAALRAAEPCANERRAHLQYSALSGFWVGVAAGSDLLAAFWAVTLLVYLAWSRSGRGPDGVSSASLAWRGRVALAAVFCLAWGLGFLAASPMYAAHPLEALKDVSTRVQWWDSVDEHLWLGQEVNSVPAYAYLLTGLVKISPLCWAAALLGALVAVRSGRYLLLGCLWPVLYISLKPWKSPYYVTAYLPVFYLLVTIGLREVYEFLAWRASDSALASHASAPGRVVSAAGVRPAASSRMRRWSAPAVLVLVLAAQGGMNLDAHPDYLMSGIRWADALYGGFAGPAVSHGQWTGEALAFVRRDFGPGTPKIMIFQGFAPAQIEFYAARHGLTALYNSTTLEPRQGSRMDYLVVSQDCLRYREGRKLNKRLLALARDRERFRLVRTFSSGPFPMVWVYKR